MNTDPEIEPANGLLSSDFSGLGGTALRECPNLAQITPDTYLMDSWFTHDSNLIDHIESYDKDWIGPLRSNRQVTYGGEDIRVDALEERIDKTEREIDDETYKIWTQKRSVSKLGEVRLLIAEKVTEEDEVLC